MDTTGEQHLHIEHNIFKRRLDLNGKPIEDPQRTSKCNVAFDIKCNIAFDMQQQLETSCKKMFYCRYYRCEGYQQNYGEGNAGFLDIF